MKTIYTICCMLLLLLGVTAASLAQSTDATIRGSVVDVEGEPLPGATVRIVNESTGFSTGTSTNANGNFAVRQLPLGGPYTVTVSFVGFSEDVRSDIQLNLGDRVDLEFIITEDVGMLDEVVVTAGLRDRTARLGGTTEISSREISSLPVQDRNFTNLAELSPTLGRGLNFAGARNISTNFTVDGMNARGNRTGGEQGRGPFSISMEAIREFEVETNNYDVTVGRQGGGGINAATKSGTNNFEASTFGYLRSNELTANRDLRGNTIDDSFSNVQWGFTAGGPIREDRAHFFVAFDRQDAQRPIDVINLNGDDDIFRNNISQDAMDRLVGVAGDQYGLDVSDQYGMFTQDGVQNALFAKVDWQLNDQHRVTFVNNFTLFNSDFVAGGDRLALRESRPNRYSLVNTTSLSLRSSFSENFLNTLSLQVNRSDDEARQDIGIVPRIFVNVDSEMPDGSMANQTIQMGGHRWSPNFSNERNAQIKNVSYYSRDNVTYTFGADLLFSYHDVWISSEQFGLYEFNSLDDFEAMQPFRYSRLAPLGGEVETGMNFWAVDSGIFAQAEFQASRDVDLLLGLRYDIHTTLSTPEYNPLLEQRFGVRNDNRPMDLTNFAPRFQVSWDVGGRGRDLIRFGAGGFSSLNNYYAYITNFLYNGMELASVTLTGDDVPTPDFESYRNDPSTIPGAPAGFDAPALIAYTSDDAGTPYTWKGNLLYNRFITDQFRAGINFLGSYTVNNYHYFDRNLQPHFTTDPDNLQVFVPASSISENGNTNYFDGRQHNEFEQVLEMVSEGEAYSYGFVLDTDYAFHSGARISASYTWNRARENTPYNGNNAISAINTPVSGDPRNLEWAPANNDFRHKLVIRGSLPEIYGFRVSGSYVGISGGYTNVRVNRDIRGTGTTGDELAFIFDPNDPATPANIAEGMQALLDNPDNELRGYLQDNLGTRATRNGARVNPFTGIINMRISREVNFPGFNAEIMLDAFNVANIFNNEWGYTSIMGGNQTLLNVNGFDQDTQQYEYSVNPNFGRSALNGTPYQIQLGVRLSI